MLLSTSSKTIKWRGKDWNIPMYTKVSDAQLDEAVQGVLRQFPSSGEVIICGHLQAQKVIECNVDNRSTLLYQSG